MPWTALLRMARAHAGAEREAQLSLAAAVRVATQADAQEWQRFADAVSGGAGGGESDWDRMHARNERWLARQAAERGGGG